MFLFSYILIGEYMKKIGIVLLILMFFILSIYYTDKSLDTLKEKDPIMQKIKENTKFNIEPVNAIIKDNTITPGIDGIKIDQKKSYNQMKKYGTYNESLTRLKKEKPSISIDNYYDLYIEGGNPTKRKIAIVFTIDDIFPDEVLYILNLKGYKATFFIDGTLLEENISKIRESNMEFELLSYDGKYNTSLLKTSLSFLEGIKDEKAKFCFTEKENKNLLSFCSKNHLHTIKATNIFSNNLYHNIKINLSNGKIFIIRINNYTLKELLTSLDYVYSKGYEIVSLQNLLSEELE